MRESSERRRFDPHRPSNLLAAALLAIAGLLLLSALALQLYARRYAARIYPGVNLAGEALGGLTEAEAAARMTTLPALDGDIRLLDPEDGRSWDLSSAELGLRLDAAFLAGQAMRIGRDDSLSGPARLLEPLRVRRAGFDLAQLIGFDADLARERLEALAPEVMVAPENARVEREEGRVVSKPSIRGHVLDVEGSLARLGQLASRPITDTVELAVGLTAPRLFDLSNVTEAYELIVSGPIELNWREGQRYIVPLDALESWVSIEEISNDEGDALPSIILDRDGMRAWLSPLAAEIDHPPVDARYAIDPATGRFALLDAGTAGTRFDLEGSVDRLIQAAYTEQRVAELAVELIPRQVHGDLLRELNTSLEEIGRVATSFTGSPTGRLQNLLVAADRLDGLTLAPGQEASFLASLGEVSEAAGYDMFQLLGAAPGPLPTPTPEQESDLAEATPLAQLPVSAAGLAGGISQVASTLFRAAFWTGLPITERHAPPVRIGWLEPPVGLDATVFPERYDLKFLNDTEGFLVFDLRLDTERGLLDCIVYGRGGDARQVRMIGPTVAEVLPAARPASLREPQLASGQSAQIGWAREGATTVVERRVTVAGEARPPDIFASRYAPAGDLVVIGTGP